MRARRQFSLNVVQRVKEWGYDNINKLKAVENIDSLGFIHIKFALSAIVSKRIILKGGYTLCYGDPACFFIPLVERRGLSRI